MPRKFTISITTMNIKQFPETYLHNFFKDYTHTRKQNYPSPVEHRLSDRVWEPAPTSWSFLLIVKQIRAQDKVGLFVDNLREFFLFLYGNIHYDTSLEGGSYAGSQSMFSSRNMENCPDINHVTPSCRKLSTI